MIRSATLGGLVLLIGIAAGCSDRAKNEEISADGKTLNPLDAPEFAADDWPWWRGPHRDNIAASGEKYATTWTKTENVQWRAEVPGRGLSSPVVVGNRIFLTTADMSRKVQTVLCYDRKTGDLKWRKDVHQGGLVNGHADNSHASSTVACDGTRVFAAFENSGSIFITALDLNGKRLWQTNAGKYSSSWGFGASPLIYKELVIIAGDGEKTGFLAALHRKTGKIFWRKDRTASDNYASPTLATIAGKDQVLLSGGKHVRSYDPMTGEQIWAVEALPETTCGTLTVVGDMVYGSGGWSDVGVSTQTTGIKVGADSATVVWKDDSLKIYVPSLLVYDGCVYGPKGSALYCLDAATGQEKWKTRLPDECYGSPVLAGGHVYLPTRKGKVVVFKPGRSQFEEVAVNTLGDEIDTTPTPVGGDLFLRVAENSGAGRQEFLYCIRPK